MPIVSEYMTPRVVTVNEDESLFTAVSLMRQHRIGALVVRQGEALVGIITDRDIAVRAGAAGRDLHRTPVHDAMTSQLYFVPRDYPVEDAARLMQKQHIHRLAVLDGDLALVGILSTDDLPRKELRSGGLSLTETL
jgi:CBS domain-containing protein